MNLNYDRQPSTEAIVEGTPKRDNYFMVPSDPYEGPRKNHSNLNENNEKRDFVTETYAENNGGQRKKREKSGAHLATM